MKNKSFAVIGLGQFGMTLAVTLAESDCDVLAIDDKEENIEEISEKVTYAVKACRLCSSPNVLTIIC